jgi:hypothetical protein
MKIPPKPDHFWVTNTSNHDVSLGDLYLTIKSYKSVNLLDSKHYHYSWEQIYKSFSSGSIFKKRNKIVARKNPPYIAKKTLVLDRNSVLPSREKSIFEIKQENYEELSLSDEQFAAENAEDIDVKI